MKLRVSRGVTGASSSVAVRSSRTAGWAPRANGRIWSWMTGVVALKKWSLGAQRGGELEGEGTQAFERWAQFGGERVHVAKGRRGL